MDGTKKTQHKNKTLNQKQRQSDIWLLYSTDIWLVMQQEAMICAPKSSFKAYFYFFLPFTFSTQLKIFKSAFEKAKFNPCTFL